MENSIPKDKEKKMKNSENRAWKIYIDIGGELTPSPFTGRYACKAKAIMAAAKLIGPATGTREKEVADILFQAGHFRKAIGHTVYAVAAL